METVLTLEVPGGVVNDTTQNFEMDFSKDEYFKNLRLVSYDFTWSLEHGVIFWERPHRTAPHRSTYSIIVSSYRYRRFVFCFVRFIFFRISFFVSRPHFDATENLFHENYVVTAAFSKEPPATVCRKAGDGFPRTMLNDSEDDIKSLLNMRKEAAVSKLLTLLPLVRRVEAKMVLLKILPVFFGHAEVFNQNLKEVIYMTRMLLNHPLFVKEKSLFGAWFVRLLDASKRSAPRSSSNEGAQKVVAKNFVHKFVSIPGTDFVDPIGYAELDFFNSE
ncbi:hypothetical protein V9T40_014146 [Parthenolecanium corni]|uniref:SMAUG/ZCCHC2-like PHAT domain-containing protein n=1 Tax=Parthenolecanium corni TaxID=536013 RepID=A0AAN9Y3B7_9HEMI